MELDSEYRNTISAVIIEQLAKHGIREAHLAREINLPRATINRIKSGKISDPKASTLTLIANFFNITVDQLLGYTPIMSRANPKDTVCTMQVPVIKLDQIQESHKDVTKKIRAKEHKEWVSYETSKDRANRNSIFAFKVRGDAMWPYFDDNTILFIDTKLPPQNRTHVMAYISSRDEIVLRKLLVDGRSRILQPVNPAFDAIKLEEADSIIGVVVEAKKVYPMLDE